MTVPTNIDFGAGAWWGQLATEFTREILGEWKAWLTGSAPMASLTVTGLVKPEWVQFPLWIWASLIFGAGLLFAMFRVYRDLRRERDALKHRSGMSRFEGAYLLVPWNGENGPSAPITIRIGEISNDL